MSLEGGIARPSSRTIVQTLKCPFCTETDSAGQQHRTGEVKVWIKDGKTVEVACAWFQLIENAGTCNADGANRSRCVVWNY